MISYQPMHDKKKEVSFERMQQILAKHCPMLTWQRVDKYAQESTCLRFTVAAAKMPQGWVFDAWERRTGQMAKHLGCFSTAELARECCSKRSREPHV